MDKVNYRLTWNICRLVQVGKRKHIHFLNTQLHLSVPEIVTPLELLLEEEQ